MRKWNPSILDISIGLVPVSGNRAISRTMDAARYIAMNDLSLARGGTRVRRTSAALIGVINCELDESKPAYVKANRNCDDDICRYYVVPVTDGESAKVDEESIGYEK